MTWESHDDEPTLFFARLGSIAETSRRWEDRPHRDLVGAVLLVEPWRLPSARALVRSMGLDRLVTLGTKP